MRICTIYYWSAFCLPPKNLSALDSVIGVWLYLECSQMPHIDSLDSEKFNYEILILKSSQPRLKHSRGFKAHGMYSISRNITSKEERYHLHIEEVPEVRWQIPQ